MHGYRWVVSRMLSFMDRSARKRGFPLPSFHLSSYITKKMNPKSQLKFPLFSRLLFSGLEWSILLSRCFWKKKKKIHFNFTAPWIGRTIERESVKWKSHFACLWFTHWSLKNSRNWEFLNQCVKWVSQKCCPEEQARLHINRNSFKY